MMLISRKKILELLKENDVANNIISGPMALFFINKKKNNKKPPKAITITISLHHSFIFVKYNNFFIPIHIYRLNEIR